MRCPHCQTENREDRVACYHCGRDLTMVRLIVNRARQYHNEAVEHLERSRHHDALAALEKALELDSALAESLVLRGTILARMDRLDEAAETWRRVLALEPQANRAHQYLGNIAEIRAFSPLMRRLRVVVYGAVAISVLMIGVAITVFTLMREPVEERAVRQAWAAWQDGNWGLAYETAEQTRDESVQLELLAAMQGTAEARIQEARELKYEQQFREASGILQALLNLDPPDILRSRVLRERNLLEGALIERIESGVAALRRGDLGELPTVDRELAELEGLFLEAQDQVDRLRNERDQALRTRLAVVVDGLLSPPWQPGAVEYLAPLEEARTIARLLGEEERMEERLGPLLASQSAQYLTAAEEAAEQGNQIEYERAMRGLRSLGAVAEEPLERAEELRPVLIQNLQERTGRELETALAEGNLPAALRLAEELAELGGAPTADQAEALRRARERLALQAYYALMDRTDWPDGPLPGTAAAREIVALVEQARGHLPERLTARAGENLLFAEWRARRALGEEDHAGELAAELRERHPQSPYLRQL